MAQNITLLGATYNDVPSVLLPKQGGGQAEFIDKEAWNWLGVEPRLIGTPYSDDFTLDDTDFAEWTASTTAHTLVATSNAATFVADMENNAYALRWRWQADIRSLEGATLKAFPVYQCGEIWQLLFRRPNSLANLAADNFVGNATVATRSAPLMKYYNTSGTLTYTYTASYGFYCAATAPTFSSSTSSSPTVTIKTPATSVRCNSSYFATARKPYVDTASPIKFMCMLYQLPKECMEWQIHKGLVDLYNNPI